MKATTKYKLKRWFGLVPLAILIALAIALFPPAPMKISASPNVLSVSIGNNRYAPGELSDWIIKFEPSGTHVKDGSLKIRLDFYPSESSKSYDSQHVYVVDETSLEYLAGYKGKVDKDGQPVDIADYQKWFDGLPHIWRVNPALSHFITVKPDITAAELDNIIKSYFDAGVVATIDDCMSRGNSAHLISPYMEDKIVTTSVKVQAGQNKEALVTAVNNRLSNFSIKGDGGGQVQPIEPKSIDVGPGAIDRAGELSSSYTFIDLNNPANADGTLDTWELWFKTGYDGVNVETATFYLVSGSNYSTRDSETIGSVTSGSKQTFTGLSTDVNTDDYAGVYKPGGRIERDTTGFLGILYANGDFIPCTNQAFSLVADDAISIYATGTEPASFDISNSPDSKAFGIVAASSTYYADGGAPHNPVEDGDCNFTITNNGATAIDLDMKIADFTGGVGWNIAGAVGADTVKVTTYYTGQNPASGLVLTNADQEFYDGLAASATIKWDLRLDTGTFTDGAAKSATLTITATAED
jgi:hypothetical protein